MNNRSPRLRLQPESHQHLKQRFFEATCQIKGTKIVCEQCLPGDYKIYHKSIIISDQMFGPDCNMVNSSFSKQDFWNRSTFKFFVMDLILSDRPTLC